MDENIGKEIMNSMLSEIAEGKLWGIRMIWNGVLRFVIENWLWIFGVFLILILVSVLRALSGRWGGLGSLLYNFFYFGILFTIALVFGPEFFVKDYFNLFAVIVLYPLCYFLVGRILNRFGFRR